MDMISNKPTAHSGTVTLEAPSATDKHCLFRSGLSWFAVPAIVVREIAISPALVRVPHSDAALAGMCHLRSEFIPVISLKALLRLEGGRDERPDRQLLVIKSSSVWSLQIAEAAAIRSLETLATPDTRGDESNPTPVIGTAMFQEQIVRVLDPGGIFRLAQQTLENLWSPSAPSVAQAHYQTGSQG